jgi:AcrR family transcriptional regulator
MAASNQVTTSVVELYYRCSAFGYTLRVTITLAPRTRQVGDAAIAVLAEHGARGLTHRAVDQAAGLPPGTTSNYARTREALLTLTLTRIAELDLAEGAATAGSGLADDVARMVHQWIIEPGRRRRFLARLELAFEATRRPELRAAYDEMGRGFRTEAARLLAAAGSAHPERDAWTLIAWVEGTAFYALAGAGGAAVPSLAELRAQVTGLLASLYGDDAGAA